MNAEAISSAKKEKAGRPSGCGECGAARRQSGTSIAPAPAAIAFAPGAVEIGGRFALVSAGAAPGV
ncbi:hypothetical protein, partial [Burkholderia vietnamiensis]|uniref:hypothetical protein n=1 Tax=Burkholderia vietnamiensis TaxID=60552 RepID=UPI002DD41D10